MEGKVGYIFGPVPSRRLGLSLGVDLIPMKTCSYDCLYCQVGATTSKTIRPKDFVSVEDVCTELAEALQRRTPDVITLSGSGEPTLHAGIDRLIMRIRDVTDVQTALLTNGSLLWEEKIRRRLVHIDRVMPTLCTAREETFEAIHRPHKDLRLPNIIEGLIRFRDIFRGRLALEVMLLAGFNDTDAEIEALAGVVERIGPDHVNLNTVVRPPSDPRAIALDRRRLEEIQKFFGEKADIVADRLPERRNPQFESLISAVLDMAKRRPVRASDVGRSMDLDPKEAEDLLKGLVVKNRLKRRDHEGETYYSASGMI
jgi:wyosine [tRNA(Phe)-imidazoG37] synthetase (radical SAM superfamily)